MFYYRWMVYVRGVDNEDLSPFIDKVVFVLHDSFQNNVRTVDKHPFVLEENGWGEFEIIIRIFFKAEYAKLHVQLSHFLKFHQSQTNKKLFLSEFFDELIFVNPSAEFEQIVQSTFIEKKAKLELEPLIEQPDSTDKDVRTATLGNSIPIPSNSGLSLRENTEWNFEALTEQSVFNEKAQELLLEDANAFIEKEVQSLISKISTIEGELSILKDSLKD